MKRIDGEAKNVRDLLSGKKYTIDYYQREYNWQTKQVHELIDDLTTRFLDDFDSAHERHEVQSYGHYFLGSIIISCKDNQHYIVDGQQRLTTLTLLLIHLYHRQPHDEDRALLQDLIFSRAFGRRSFNIDVEERAACMDAIYQDKAFDTNDQPNSVTNLVGRFDDIEGLLQEALSEEAISHFTDWLINNVHLVEIRAYSDDDAYTIFETMNDRGLPLSPLDMLKGYLLANITDQRLRNEASKCWKKHLTKLNDLERDEATDAVKAWLRSQHATTIRERKRNSTPGDFDRIGTEFHRWVREQETDLGLAKGSDFSDFIQRDFDFYARQHLRLRRAARTLTPGLETVFYIAHVDLTLQYPLLLAPLRPDDDERTIDRKVRVTAAFLDILIARRAVNYLSLTYNAIVYTLFPVLKKIRGLELPELTRTLRHELDTLDCTLDEAKDGRRSGFQSFMLNQWSKRYIRHILARLTDHLERMSGMKPCFADYIVTSGRNRYEIEHIWSDHPERHEDEFPSGHGFSDYRNRIGGLLLLPKSFNASYGALPYEDKLKHYDSQNLLARSLHPNCYDHTPGFCQYVRQSGLPFRAHEQFKRADLDARQNLYYELAKEIWNPERLEREAES